MSRCVLVPALVISVYGSPCLAGELKVEHVGTLGTKCSAVALAFLGQHSYVVANASLVNIDDPEKPDPKPGFMFLSQIMHVKTAGTHAYLAANVGGLKILDISDPDDTKVVATYTPEEMRSAALCVDVAGKYAYVTFAGAIRSKHHGLHILDISDPARPKPVGLYASDGTFVDVVVSGNYAYVTISESGLHIVAVQDPSKPRLVGSCRLPGLAGGIALIDNHCLVTVHDAGLAVVDIGDPAKPILRTTCDMAGSPIKVTASGNEAYVAAQQGGMHVVDITDIDRLRVLASYPGRSKMPTVHVAVAGDYAFLANLVHMEVVRITRRDR